MKQFIISIAIILAVAAVLMLNGLVENVKDVSFSSFSEEDSSSQAAAQPSGENILIPADLGEIFDEETTVPTDAEVLSAELDYFFDAKLEEDGYIVEIYREYEIYKDANGKVIKEVPTSNFEYIRYKE
ncbi:hypothetical protein [Bacillus sp. AK031]